MKIGVVGLGHLGKEHARIYSELDSVDLVACCDSDTSRKDIAIACHAPFFSKPSDLLEKVDAVSIAVPTSLHYKIALPFLQAGIHVLVEKPITDKLEDADHLIDLAREKNVVLRVGHIERFNSAFRRIAKLLDQPRFIEIDRLGPYHTRIKDCGVVLDLMIHDIDIVLGLVDSEIESMDAVGLSAITAFEDLAKVRLRFKNGCIADFTASRITPERQRKIRIFQEDAYLSIDYGAQTAQIVRKKFLGIDKQEIDIQSEEPLRKELEDFVQTCLRKDTQRPVDTGARDALALALKITQDIKAYQEGLKTKVKR